MATAVAYELPVIICIFNNGYLGNVRQWQEMFFDRHYSSTCIQRRKSCPLPCNSPGENCPDYIPDFIKLAGSYGAAGIRVTAEEEIDKALLSANGTKKVLPSLNLLLAGKKTSCRSCLRETGSAI